MRASVGGGLVYLRPAVALLVDSGRAAFELNWRKRTFVQMKGRRLINRSLVRSAPTAYLGWATF